MALPNIEARDASCKLIVLDSHGAVLGIDVSKLPSSSSKWSHRDLQGTLHGGPL